MMARISIYRWLRYLAVAFLCVLLLLAALFILWGEPVGPEAPTRPDNVPEQAAWVGGTDGGVWIDCVPRELEPDEVCYHCDIYDNDQHGTKVAESGTYVARRIEWDMQTEAPKFLPVTEKMPDPLPYNGFDGTMILLDSHRALVSWDVLSGVER